MLKKTTQNKIIKRHKTTITLVFLAISSAVNSPALADKYASAITVKVGYFNAGVVKASCPEGGDSEQLKNQAEAQLRRDAEDSNKRLQKALEDKKPQDEIQKLKDQLQIEINAKQQALAQLVQTSFASLNAKIAQAVNSVAKDKGLDLVIDGAGVYAGGTKIVDNGVDITQELVQKLTGGLNKSATR